MSPFPNVWLNAQLPGARSFWFGSGPVVLSLGSCADSDQWVWPEKPKSASQSSSASPFHWLSSYSHPPVCQAACYHDDWSHSSDFCSLPVSPSLVHQLCLCCSLFSWGGEHPHTTGWALDWESGDLSFAANAWNLRDAPQLPFFSHAQWGLNQITQGVS